MDLASFGQIPSPEIDYLYGLRRGETSLGLASTRRLFAVSGTRNAALDRLATELEERQPDGPAPDAWSGEPRRD